ncbi:hypothetical protein [Shewanella algae]|uniref:hypothetical protein n=1 Tax=Shewanella algae TaxID=38313 RepID=UPI0016423D4B|nr:hypothetical protein [Shewanella algae]TVO87825.1 hypothetical protein AYI76_00125 [Shewanella algae]TVO89429.1 hypothetical protein AYI78_00125 [Shewanella algae]TVO99422.1 hypothetical protein AYI79_00125 [Shewanella algae]
MSITLSLTLSLALGITASLGQFAMANTQSVSNQPGSQEHVHVKAGGSIGDDANVCAAKPGRFQASYQITVGSGEQARQQQLTLTRFDDTIIYQRSPVSYEAWHKNGEYVRYFPQEKRSISYRRGDLLALNIHTDLDRQFHLISPAALSQFEKGQSLQDSCFTRQSYSFNSKGHEENHSHDEGHEESHEENHSHANKSAANEPQSLQLSWISELELPAEMTITQGEQRIVYRLSKLTPVSQESFKRLTSGFQDLDFADVGDSESDPFIAKMITQGFIQHGSSGFYSADGQQLEGGHHSH